MTTRNRDWFVWIGCFLLVAVCAYWWSEFKLAAAERSRITKEKEEAVKEKEAALKEKEDALLELVRLQLRYKAILDIMPVGTIACDSGGVVTMSTYEVTRLLGWQEHDLVGRPIGNILPPEMAAKHGAGQRRFLEKLRQKVEDSEEGSGAWEVTKVIPYGEAYNRDGEIVRLLVRMRAISINGTVEQIATIAKAQEEEEQAVPLPKPFEPPPAPPVVKELTSLLKKGPN